jgi:hypothetical protein
VNLGGLGVDRIRTCKSVKTLRINYLYCLTCIMQCNKERMLLKYKCYKWLKIIGITKKNKKIEKNVNKNTTCIIVLQNSLTKESYKIVLQNSLKNSLTK